MTAPLASTGVSLNPAAKPERQQLREAAQAFEAILLRQMLSTARAGGFGDALGSSQAMDTFRSMQDEQFADIAAKSGSLGLATMIEAQLSRNLPAPPPTPAKEP